MRYVRKGLTGGHGLEAHGLEPATPEEAESRWRSFGHKSGVLERLLWEQFYLCCYSEIRPDEEELGFHIEHVENKSLNPSRTSDYNNLAASALRSEDLPQFKAPGEQVFGGHASGKRAGVDPARFVSCHQPDCARFFAFLSDGRVVPAIALDAGDRDRAQYTIDLLNLNSPFLIVRRRQWWSGLDGELEAHLREGWSLEFLADADLIPRTDRFGSRALSRFFSLTRQFYGLLAERLLALHPELL